MVLKVRMSDAFVVSTASSAMAGLIARTICHPIDTVKAKLQSGDSFKGTFDVVKTTFMKEGPLGFYRGIGAVMVGGMPGVCIYITSYEASKKSLQQYSYINANPFLSYFISGMIAEAVCCTLFVPVDVIKERLQVQSNRPDKAYTGSINALKTIIAEEGAKALYKGYTATLFSYGPFSALYFLFYEELKDRLGRIGDRKGDASSLSFTENLACSALAGSVASFVTNPLDLAKLRYQVQRSIKKTNTNTNTTRITYAASTAGAGSSIANTATSRATGTGIGAAGGREEVYTGLVDALGKLYRQHGLRGLFRGSLARVLFFTPNTAITMAAYDKFKEILSAKR